MNVIQIKNHIDDFDKHYPFRKLVLLFGLLPTAIFFPINFFFNPNVNPIVKNSPFLIGEGFLAFIAMFLVLSIGGLFVIRIAIDGYLAYGRFNARSMLADDQAPREFSRRSKKHIISDLRSELEPRFEELDSRQLNTENDVLDLKNKLETKDKNNSSLEKLLSDLSIRFNIKSLSNDYRVSKLERQVKELQDKLRNSVPLSEYNILYEEILNLKQEIAKLKGV